MGEKTGISWCDHTFNPWWGCTRISAGCDNCYADAQAQRFGFQCWDGRPRRFFGDRHWAEPLKWNEAAALAGVRRRVFAGSMCDVFEDVYCDCDTRRLANKQRDRLFALIEKTPWLDWLLCTKRPENMPTLAPRSWAHCWPPNVWALATVENQEVCESRINDLLRVPAFLRGLSIEPMLSRIDLGVRNWASDPAYRIHWVIVGCESGPNRRPSCLDDVRFVVEDCEIARMAVFVKQLADLSGRVSANPAEWPEDLRIQEFPR
jgi:protein gp37